MSSTVNESSARFLTEAKYIPKAYGDPARLGNAVSDNEKAVFAFNYLSLVPYDSSFAGDNSFFWPTEVEASKGISSEFLKSPARIEDHETILQDQENELYTTLLQSTMLNVYGTITPMLEPILWTRSEGAVPSEFWHKLLKSKPSCSLIIWSNVHSLINMGDLRADEVSVYKERFFDLLKKEEASRTVELNWGPRTLRTGRLEVVTVNNARKLSHKFLRYLKDEFSKSGADCRNADTLANYQRSSLGGLFSRKAVMHFCGSPVAKADMWAFVAYL